MTRPNVFLAGFPKCGTTSLAYWLGAHPQAYLSPVKEPHFHATDLGLGDGLTHAGYDALFAGAVRARAVCDASANTILSQVAVPMIEAQYDAPRYLICLRNPVEMAPACHGESLYNGSEPEPDFARAWAQGQSRRGGGLCLQDYARVCSLGAHLERFLSHVPRSRLHLCFLEDFRGPEEAAALAQIEGFLGLAPSGRRTLGQRNAAKALVLPGMGRWLKGAARLKRRMGITRSLGIERHLRRTRPRAPLGPDMRNLLIDAFADDVALLARLTGRDLSHWLVRP